jgi:hypothetical protein
MQSHHVDSKMIEERVGIAGGCRKLLGVEMVMSVETDLSSLKGKK